MNGGEYTYKPAYRKLIENGDLGGGIAADDGVALHYKGKKLHKVVSSRPNAFAYQVSFTEDGLIEKQLKPYYLSKKPEVTDL